MYPHFVIEKISAEMKTILVIFIINVLMKEGTCDTNPCPHIIEFKSDENEDFAVITIAPSLVSKFNSLKVKLEFPEEPTGGDNGIKLVKSKDEVVNDIKQGKNIEFKLNFLQSSLLPVITKITINRKSICNGVEGIGEYEFDIQTTFLLPSLSTSTPSASSQLSAANTSSVQSGNASWLQALPFAGTCGKPLEATQTIIGGVEVTEGEYPWMVAMYHHQPEQRESKIYVCGASLISDMHVITAAHCVQKQTQIYLEFGRYNFDDDYETHYVTRTSWEIFSHPEYQKAAHGDIALVSFHPRVTFTQWIVPICLWDNFDSELHRGTVAGWGQQDNNNASQSTTPKKLTISMVELNKCRNSHLVLQKFATNKTFCAGGAGAGPCHGDSGGGFFVTHRHVTYLRGIISHSVGDAERCNVDEYAVYADLAYALDWLRPYLTADPVGVSIATKKCEEYKQLRANMDKSLRNIVTSVSQYPHVALVEGRVSSGSCMGALISEQFILTSAYCLYSYGFLAPWSTVHLGFLDKGNRNESGTLQVFNLTQYYRYPSYKLGFDYADIALLKLDRPVEYTKGVIPACLHEDVNIPDKIQEIGWELQYGPGENLDLLQVVNISLRTEAECVRAYPTYRMYPPAGIEVESLFCAKIKERRRCYYLSQEKFSNLLQIVDKLGTPRIVGTLPHFRSCSETLFYTKVSHYVRWIESIVWPGASGHSTGKDTSASKEEH